MASITTNKMDIFDYLGGASHLHIHPTESLIAYDGGSCIMLWEILEDIKVRVHEHSNPIKCVKFFGEGQRFIFSADYRTIIISEWHNLKRVAELSIPLKKGDSPAGNMMMDYTNNSMLIMTRLGPQTYRLTILSFIEFTLQFVFSADISGGGIPRLVEFIQLEKLGIIVVEDSAVKLWTIEDGFLASRCQVALHKPVLSAAVLSSRAEIIVLMENSLVVSLNKKVVSKLTQLEFMSKNQLKEPQLTRIAKWSDDCIVFFSKESRMYVYEWPKKRCSQDIYIREKVDFFAIEYFGELENKVLDGDYQIDQAICHGKKL